MEIFCVYWVLIKWYKKSSQNKKGKLNSKTNKSDTILERKHWGVVRRAFGERNIMKNIINISTNWIKSTKYKINIITKNNIYKKQGRIENEGRIFCVLVLRFGAEMNDRRAIVATVFLCGSFFDGGREFFWERNDWKKRIPFKYKNRKISKNWK